jgi:hypothetical protein
MVAHESLAKEASALLEVIAAKLEKTASSEQPHDRQRCTGCPVCVALTYLDDHRDVAAQLAQGGLLIVEALRQYLDQPAAGTAPAATSEPVQHIDIT